MYCIVCESADVLYRTTSAEYGLRSPTAHTAPSTYWPRTNKFSDVCNLPPSVSLSVGVSVSFCGQCVFK